MTEQRTSADELLLEVREKADELERLLDTFSQRLRRMREQNKQVMVEIEGFEDELDRLRRWLQGHL
jgi:uncharacterized protein Yka (UPF0111/DUF47 family)